MHSSWQKALTPAAELLTEIEKQLSSEIQITPPRNLVMRAFEQPLGSVRVVLIGQDPYPTAGNACGLAFAVPPEFRQPQSLRNLMGELATDIPEASNGGDLRAWSRQGVMLLNSALTTRIGSPGAHAVLWRGFTSLVIKTLDTALSQNLVCLSLGEHAKKVSGEILLGRVIQATHPSPLSANRGFFGSRIYSRVNQALGERAIAPIDWSC